MATWYLPNDPYNDDPPLGGPRMSDDRPPSKEPTQRELGRLYRLTAMLGFDNMAVDCADYIRCCNPTLRQRIDLLCPADRVSLPEPGSDAAKRLYSKIRSCYRGEMAEQTVAYNSVVTGPFNFLSQLCLPCSPFGKAYNLHPDTPIFGDKYNTPGFIWSRPHELIPADVRLEADPYRMSQQRHRQIKDLAEKALGSDKKALAFMQYILHGLAGDVCYEWLLVFLPKPPQQPREGSDNYNRATRLIQRNFALLGSSAV